MLIRYPGSKDQHLKYLERHLLPFAQRYSAVAEPFSGTAAITFFLLKKKLVNKYWINDFDSAMAALWTVVRDNPDELIALIEQYTPRAEDFYAFKADGGTTLMELAFRKVVLHQISYSGLGPKAGSPIGGKNQTGKYKVDCRWRPHLLKKKILNCSALLNSAESTITSLSWEQMLTPALEVGYFVYLDPPYYAQGNSLYSNGTIDHAGLAQSLQGSENWMVSYDDAPEVRDMYSWADVQRLDVRSHLHHKSIGDVVILPPEAPVQSYAW